MKRLVSRLPSMRALIAFEAVVRLGSVTAAARELGSTQPSVSQHLRSLESDFGLPLFRKAGRRLQPTSAALAYFDQVSAAFHQLADGADRLRGEGIRSGRRLVLSANFGFAHLWLLPRLALLEAAARDIEIQVLPADRDDGPEQAHSDIDIYFGPFGRCLPGDTPLFEELVFPVCSPAFARERRLDRSTTPQALLELPLLHMDEQDPRWLDWPRWLSMAGTTRPLRPARMYYRNYPLLLNAASAGHGVALGWDRLVDRLIADGRLVAISVPVRRSGWGYVLRRPARPTAASEALCMALLAQLTADRSGTAASHEP